MKKPIPTPVVIGAIALVALVLGFFIFRSAGSTAEISKTPEKLPGYTDEMPAYIKEGRAPTADEASKMGGPPKGAAPAGATGATGAPAPTGQ